MLPAVVDHEEIDTVPTKRVLIIAAATGGGAAFGWLQAACGT